MKGILKEENNLEKCDASNLFLLQTTANAKSIEEIKSFLSRQKEVYKIPYETHPEDRLRQCVFGGTSNALDFLPLDRSWNRRFLPVMVYPEQMCIRDRARTEKPHPKRKEPDRERS